MKRSTIITIALFVVGMFLLTAGFILFTDNNISNGIFTTTTTTTGGNGGGDDPKHDPMDLLNTDLSQYITLGQYKDLEIEVDMLEVSDEYINTQIDNLLISKGKYTKLFEGTVTEGAVFSFNYVGYLDGVPFDKGNAAGAEAYISDGVFYLTSGTSFIEGFAEGVLGAEVGEWFEITAKFPDNYGEETLKGKEVIFDIKINYIAEANEPTDALIKECTSNKYETVEAYKTYLKSSAESQIKQNNLNTLWQTIYDNSTIISVPQQQLDYWYYYYRGMVEYYVEYYGMFGYTVTYEQMLVEMGFENDDALKTYAKETVETELVVFAIMKAEDITATDEEYEKLVTDLMASENKTREEIISAYGEDQMRKDIMTSKTETFVEKNNSFVLNSDSEE